MNFTKFEKLLEVVRSIGADPVIADLDRWLKLGKADVDPENLVFGGNGVYLIDPRGKLTKVILHIVDKKLNPRFFRRGGFIAFENKDYENPSLIKSIHKYHLLNCQTLQKAKEQGWRDKYKMSKREDGKFYYRYVDNNVVKVTRENQTLEVCGNCLKEFNEIIQNKNYSKKNFLPNKFFIEDFNKHWIPDDGYKPDYLSNPNVYQEDWHLISKKYRELKDYHCENENCESRNLSYDNKRKYLHCHHIDFDKSNNNYSNIKALCIRCHAEEPNHEHLKKHPDYKDYLSFH